MSGPNDSSIGTADSTDSSRTVRTGQPGQAQGLGLVGVQSGEPGPVAAEQLVTAAVPGVPVHGNARAAQ